MWIKIIFDKTSINRKFSNGWGFACLVNGHILFDTGEKAEYLFHNMEMMDIDLNNIDAVVISHDHWDHAGGLWELLEKGKEIKVFSCPGFSKEFKEKVMQKGGILKESEDFVKIDENIYVTGEIAGLYKGNYIAEQALVVRTGNGINIITGCSHPGIIKIIEKVKQKFPDEKINVALGGFHLMDKEKREIELIAEKFKAIGVEEVGPTHCSGDEAQIIFKKYYMENYLSIKAGMAFEL
jgi:7,8-dihydropterin-6-yl-methyl-4-(beta-D-ribofuranosyl)aminobenzene 5'-phosphate synthase